MALWLDISNDSDGSVLSAVGGCDDCPDWRTISFDERDVKALLSDHRASFHPNDGTGRLRLLAPKPEMAQEDAARIVKLYKERDYEELDVLLEHHKKFFTYKEITAATGLSRDQLIRRSNPQSKAAPAPKSKTEPRPKRTPRPRGAPRKPVLPEKDAQKLRSFYERKKTEPKGGPLTDEFNTLVWYYCINQGYAQSHVSEIIGVSANNINERIRRMRQTMQ